MLIYMDVCCLCRPFDDMEINRNYFEADALERIFMHARLQRDWKFIGSEIIDYEINKITDSERKAKVRALLPQAEIYMVLSIEIIARGKSLESMGAKGKDALHIASAEAAKAELFLTTDDNLIKFYERHEGEIEVILKNPLAWSQEITNQ